MEFEKSKSNSSCLISDINSITYGGFTSRFWVSRKHICSMETEELNDLPFYCWDCLTIETKHRDINLVI